MELYEIDGNYRLTRDDQRAVKAAASLTGRFVLLEIAVQYLGNRKLGPGRKGGIRWNPERQVEPEIAQIIDDVSNLDAMVERTYAGTDGFNYVYPPSLARLAVDTTALALKKGYLMDKHVNYAHDLVNSYLSIHHNELQPN